MKPGRLIHVPREQGQHSIGAAKVRPSRAGIAKHQEFFRLMSQNVARKVYVRQREKRTRCNVENIDKSPKEIICVEVPAYI